MVEWVIGKTLAHYPYLSLYKTGHTNKYLFLDDLDGLDHCFRSPSTMVTKIKFYMVIQIYDRTFEEK
jgi:hypothetical protein